MTTRTIRSLLAAIAGLASIGGADAQQVLDRVDPTRVEDTAPRDGKIVTDAPTTPRAPRDTPVAPGAPVTVGAIRLTGLVALRQADFADIVERHMGRTLAPGELAGLADMVAERARSRGYVFATARIPPQALTAGVLRVAVDEGRVDAIQLVGTQNNAVAAALAPLVTGRPVRLEELERRLLIAGDIDGIYLGKPRIRRDGERNVLEVSVRRNRYGAVLGLDNFGSRPIGPLQADLVVRMAQVLAEDDMVTLIGVVTPTQPSEFGFARLRYAKRINANGTEIGGSASVARTQPGAYLTSREIEGDSWSAAMSVLHPLLRRREASLWLDGSFGVRTVEQDRAGRRARRDRLTVARLGIYGFTPMIGGRLRASATVSQGLDLFDATRRGDPLASRRDADGTFTSIGLTADWSRAMTETLSVQLGLATQIAAQPLLVSEEIGLGGGQFLRGYDYSERSGDNGTMGSAELRWAPVPKVGPLKAPILYGFVDGGRVTNLRGGFGSGTLFSTGAGLRMTVLDIVSADIGFAVPLSGPRYDSGNDKPIINFRLIRRF